jgi:P4 family phage/plasmid primase-like protien
MSSFYEDMLGEEFGGDPDTSPRERAVAKIVDEMEKAAQYKRDRPGNVYRYTGAYWDELSKGDLESLALHAEPLATSAHRRGEIVKLLCARAHDVDFSFGRVAGHEIAFQNGVLNVYSGRLRAHRAEDYLESVLPWDYQLAAACPTWLEALGEYFGDDNQDGRHDTLQEFFGYIGLSTNRFKKALMLIGKGDTGKSLIADIGAAMVGINRTCQLSLEHMDDPTLRGVIKGARLNVMAEVSSRALISDSGFKALVAGDPVLINRKYYPAEIYLPTAKHLIAANSLPIIRGRTDEVFARFLIIAMDRVFQKGEQDPDLKDKLIAEMPGILVWMAAGAKRLLENNGRFTEPDHNAEVLEDWQAEVNPMVDYEREWLIKDGLSFVPLQTIASDLRRHLKKEVTTRRVGIWCRALGLRVKTRAVVGDKRTVKALDGYRYGGDPSTIALAQYDGDGHPEEPI